MSNRKKQTQSDLGDFTDELFGKPPAHTRAAQNNPHNEESRLQQNASTEQKSDGSELNDVAQTTAAPIDAGKQSRKKSTRTAADNEATTKRETKAREYVMTYFSDENYNSFEEMYDETKRYIRQQSGIKLKETHVAELAIMVAYELFRKDKSDFFAAVERNLNK